MKSSNGKDDPILSSGQVLSSGDLASFQKAEVEGFAYNVIAGGNGRIMIFVALHKNTHLHIVAVGDKTDIQSKLSSPQLKKHLTKIDLEGDFPSYFSMYSTPGREQELLELFNPADMAYFVDFCRAYDFELYHDSIYISQSQDAVDPDDHTVLIKDVEAFLKHNHELLSRVESSSATSGQVV